MAIMITVKLWITLFLVGIVVAVVTDVVRDEDGNIKWYKMHDIAIKSVMILIGFAFAALLAKVIAVVWAVK